MTRIFLSGAGGQLGRSIRELSSLYPDFEFLYTDIGELDITDPDAVKNQVSSFKPDFFINCAAYTAVDKAEQEKDACFRINSDAAGILGNACHQQGIKFIHVSTDYVFDGSSNRPYTEKDDTNPVSVYGQSKLDGENKLKDLDNTLIIRTSWLYSRFGHNFFRTIDRLCREKKELKVVFDQTGTPTLASDLAEAILKIIRKVKNDPAIFKPGVYHFSGEGVCSWYDFAQLISKMAGSPCSILPVRSDEFPTPAARPAYSVLDKSKIRKQFELSIPHWIDSLEKCHQTLSGK